MENFLSAYSIITLPPKIPTAHSSGYSLLFFRSLRERMLTSHAGLVICQMMRHQIAKKHDVADDKS
jgi:hypothetical protein